MIERITITITITTEKLLQTGTIQVEIKLIKEETKLEIILLEMKNTDKIEDVRELIFREKI